MDHANVPAAVFSQPPVGTIGLSEDDARRQYGEIDVYRTTFRPLKTTVSGGEGRVMMKLVVDARSDRVVGAHMVGDDAGEIIQGLAIAIKAGATKADFRSDERRGGKDGGRKSSSLGSPYPVKKKQQKNQKD